MAGHTFVEINVFLTFFQGALVIWTVVVATIYAGSAVASTFPAALVFVVILAKIRVVPVLDLLIGVILVVLMDEFMQKLQCGEDLEFTQKPGQSR